VAFRLKETRANVARHVGSNEEHAREPRWTDPGASVNVR
jgi:hypothetical protein